MFLSILLLAFLFSTGCQSHQGESIAGSPSPTLKAEGHHHDAPHQGTLVVLGEEFAHLEFLLDPTSGNLTAYVLDGEAENPVQLSGVTLELKIDGEHNLQLDPVADELTGDTEANSSKFEGASEHLKGKSEFRAVVTKLEVKGRAFDSIDFSYPQGNEAQGEPEEHHHEDGHEH